MLPIALINPSNQSPLIVGDHSLDKLTLNPCPYPSITASIHAYIHASMHLQLDRIHPLMHSTHTHSFIRPIHYGLFIANIFPHD